MVLGKRKSRVSKSKRVISNLTYGPFDAAAIPIGVSGNQDFMKYQQVSPAEAVQIHQDLKSKFSVGIHWGTLPLAGEPYLDPPSNLQKALKERDLPVDSFVTINHGEGIFIGPDGS